MSDKSGTTEPLFSDWWGCSGVVALVQVWGNKKIFLFWGDTQIIAYLLSKLIIDNKKNRMITTVSYLGPSSPNRPPVHCEEHIKRGHSIGDLFCPFDSWIRIYRWWFLQCANPLLFWVERNSCHVHSFLVLRLKKTLCSTYFMPFSTPKITRILSAMERRWIYQKCYLIYLGSHKAEEQVHSYSITIIWLILSTSPKSSFSF